MHVIYRFICGLSLITCCAQFSSQQSLERGTQKQPVNFKVKITVQGNTFSADNFSIGGLYRQIPFFTKPTDPDTDPNSNTTYIDLDEIYSIRPAYTQPREGISSFKNRSYIELIITFKDIKKTETHYIVETNRKLFCDELMTFTDPHRSDEVVQRELLFEVIELIVIESYSHQVPEKFKEKNKPSTQNPDVTNEKDAHCPTILKRISLLEEEAQKVSPADVQKNIINQLQELKIAVMPLCN